MNTAAANPSELMLDLARPLAERQLARLERLAEIGMGIAEKLGERIAAAPAEEDLGALAKAYDRAARSVRLTDMLQTKLLTDLDRALREAARRTEMAEADTQRMAEGQRKAHVERAVERLAKAKHAKDRDEVDRLVADCAERLDYEDHGWLLARPTAEILADICQGLDLPLDWETLQDLAWVKEERPLQITRPPPLAEEGDPKGGEGIPPPSTLDVSDPRPLPAHSLFP